MHPSPHYCGRSVSMKLIDNTSPVAIAENFKRVIDGLSEWSVCGNAHASQKGDTCEATIYDPMYWSVEANVYIYTVITGNGRPGGNETAGCGIIVNTSDYIVTNVLCKWDLEVASNVVAKWDAEGQLVVTCELLADNKRVDLQVYRIPVH